MIVKCFNCGKRLGKSNLTLGELYEQTVAKKKPMFCNKSRCKMQFPSPRKAGNKKFMEWLEQSFTKWYEQNEKPNQRIIVKH